jgi:hypothetical protein
VDDLFRPSDIVSDIWQMITQAKVLLADLTGKNANVFYELGLAHAAKQPVLLISRFIEDVPFDLRSLRVILYEPLLPGWDTKLRDDIQAGLLETLKAPDKSVLPTFLQISSSSEPTVTADDLRFLQLEREVASLRGQIAYMASTRPRVVSVSPVYGTVTPAFEWKGGVPQVASYEVLTDQVGGGALSTVRAAVAASALMRGTANRAEANDEAT